MSERTVHLVMRDWWETSTLSSGRRWLAEIARWLSARGFERSHRVEEVTIHG